MRNNIGNIAELSLSMFTLKNLGVWIILETNKLETTNSKPQTRNQQTRNHDAQTRNPKKKKSIFRQSIFWMIFPVDYGLKSAIFI